MKQLITRLLTSISLFILTSIAFANDINCPTATLAKQANFVSAKHIASRVWMTSSSPFTFEDNEWNVLMVFLTSAESREEAIADAQYALANAALPIEQPKPAASKGRSVCLYTNDPKGKVIVVAVNPPANDGNSVMNSYINQF